MIKLKHLKDKYRSQLTIIGVLNFFITPKVELMLTFIEKSIPVFKLVGNITTGVSISGIGEDKNKYYLEFRIIDEKSNKVIISAYKLKSTEVTYFNKGEPIPIDTNFQKILKMEFDNFTGPK